jgi:uncharacterized protein YndB with AHSA1/START domain
MKWLKIILMTLALLLLAPAVLLAILNLNQDSNRMKTSVIIHQPPAVVWPWLFEGDKLKQWVSWLKDVQRDPTPSPLVGSKGVWTMADENNGGREMKIASTVESVEPDKSLGLRLSAPEGFSGTAVYSLKANPDGTTLLEADGRYVFDNSFAKFMTPVIIWQAKKKSEMDFDHLRRLLEGGK